MSTDNDYEAEISRMVGIINDLEDLNAELAAVCKAGLSMLENTSINEWDLDVLTEMRAAISKAEVSDE